MSKFNRRLFDDIDTQTLHSMRDQGMTQKEIAKALGCSTATVARYLKGKYTKPEQNIPIFMQPKMIEEVPSKPDEPVIVPTESVSELSNKKKPSLVVISEHRLVDLRGAVCFYHVDTAARMLEMKTGGLVSGILDTETLDTFIQELNAIRQMFVSMPA